MEKENRRKEERFQAVIMTLVLIATVVFANLAVSYM